MGKDSILKIQRKGFSHPPFISAFHGGTLFPSPSDVPSLWLEPFNHCVEQ